MNINLRYPHFEHEHFTAGDYEQFVSYLNTHYKNRGGFAPFQPPSQKDESETPSHKWGGEGGDFPPHPPYVSKLQWEKYTNDGMDDYFQTFEHIFYKYKKGIYVQIIENKINIFLPFSNVNYRNEYEKYLDINKNKYTNFLEMYLNQL